MRKFMAVVLLAALVAQAGGHQGDKKESPKRYGLDQDSKHYPQTNPKEALGSVLRAIGERDYPYLLAYLADPGFVDQRVSMYAMNLSPKLSEAEKKSLAFEKLVQQTIDNFKDNPTKIGELRRFLEDGEWDEGENEAVAKLKNISSRKVFMKKVGDRWTLQDREK
jgi:hypothetical protein